MSQVHESADTAKMPVSEAPRERWPFFAIYEVVSRVKRERFRLTPISILKEIAAQELIQPNTAENLIDQRF